MKIIEAQAYISRLISEKENYQNLIIEHCVSHVGHKPIIDVESLMDKINKIEDIIVKLSLVISKASISIEETMCRKAIFEEKNEFMKKVIDSQISKIQEGAGQLEAIFEIEDLIKEVKENEFKIDQLSQEITDFFNNEKVEVEIDVKS